MQFFSLSGTQRTISVQLDLLSIQLECGCGNGSSRSEGRNCVRNRHRVSLPDGHDNSGKRIYLGFGILSGKVNFPPH